jgi:hypothetical protein
MNDLSHASESADLAERITALNAVVKRLSEDAEWLRGEAKRLRTEEANRRLGTRMPLWFLLQLQHEQLPIEIVEPAEIRCVSALTATGLIEAEIGALGATARYAASQLVTVTRITEGGRAAIARIGSAPMSMAGSSQVASAFG